MFLFLEDIASFPYSNKAQLYQCDVYLAAVSHANYLEKHRSLMKLYGLPPRYIKDNVDGNLYEILKPIGKQKWRATLTVPIVKWPVKIHQSPVESSLNSHIS